MTRMLLVVATLGGIWSAPKSDGAEPELPMMTLIGPSPKVSRGIVSNIFVNGKVSIPLYAEVDINFYHVLPDGRLLAEGGGSVPLARDGTFRLSINPQRHGWRPGTLRVDVRLNQMRQVKASVDIEIKAKDDGAIAEIPFEEQVSSGVVIDDTARYVEPVKVPLGETFIVRGTYKAPPPREGVQGPGIILYARANKVVWGGGMTLPLHKGNGEYWYEVEVTAPHRPGVYHVEMASPIRDEIPGPIPRNFDLYIEVPNRK